MNDSVKPLAWYLLSLSLFALAASIIYFTYEISSISKQIPDILQRIDSTTDNIEPILDEVSGIIELVPSILKEVEATRKLIPPILKEVEQTRKMIPPILDEVAQTRKQIPAVLRESEAIRSELPAVLVSADKASVAVTDVAKQVAATRPMIPKVLKEVEITRESIPRMMTQADMLIEKARIAGKEASQGVVTGFFKGIILAPFALVGDAGKSIVGLSENEAKQLNETDFKLVEKAVLELLNNGRTGEKKEWANPANSTYGVVTLIDIYEKDGFSEEECRKLDLELFKNGDEMQNTNRSFCKDDEGKWDFAE